MFNNFQTNKNKNNNEVENVVTKFFFCCCWCCCCWSCCIYVRNSHISMDVLFLFRETTWKILFSMEELQTKNWRCNVSPNILNIYTNVYSEISSVMSNGRIDTTFDSFSRANSTQIVQREKIEQKSIQYSAPNMAK